MHDVNRKGVRFEPDDKPPLPLSIGLALQYVALFVTGIVLAPAIIVRSAGGEDSYALWAAFAALVVSGFTTIVQAWGGRKLPIGAGYVLLMGTSGTFIAVSIKALASGGAALLATLVIVSSVFQFFFAWKLVFFRRIFTPAVGGTIIMLVAATIMPIFFNLLTAVPAETSSMGAPLTASATVLTILVIIFRSAGVLRLWAPVLGAIVGCLVSVMFGIFETEKIVSASWFGMPVIGWPGWEFDFSPAFWVLLPSFIFVTMIGAIETIGDSVAIQQVSWRKPRSIDFKAMQAAVSADGLGNLLSGLLHTIPNTTYSNSISMVELTGVAARKVGMWIGIILIVFAFFPKLIAVLLSIPSPVAAGYMAVMISLLFVVGMKLVIRHGDYRNCAIAAIGFWLGYGFQNGSIFPELLTGGTWSLLLQDGMTSGGLVAITLTIIMELVSPRRQKIKIKLCPNDVPKIHAFLSKFAARNGWSKEATVRLCVAGEETVMSLIDVRKPSDQPTENTEDFDDEEEDERSERYLLMTISGDRKGVEIECIAAAGEKNLEDKMMMLKSNVEIAEERELSLRILRNVASSFRHQQYHDIDVVSLKVDAQLSG